MAALTEERRMSQRTSDVFYVVFFFIIQSILGTLVTLYTREGNVLKCIKFIKRLLEYETT